MQHVDEQGESAPSKAPSVWVAFCSEAPWYKKRAKALQASLTAYEAVTFDLVARAGALSSVARSIFGSLGGVSGEAAMLARLLEPELSESLSGRVLGTAVALDLPSLLVLDTWRKKGKLPAPILGICDELLWDDRWARFCDRLVVLDGKQRERALETAALPPSAVVVGGPFVDAALSEAAQGERPRDGLGFGEDDHLVLVSGVATEQETLGKALFQLGLMEGSHRLVFDLSQERSDVADHLRRQAEVFGVSAQLLRSAEHAPQLWAVADVIVGRPLPSQVARAMQLAKPFIALRQGEGDERRGEALRERSIGACASQMALLSVELELMASSRSQAAARSYFEAMEGKGGELRADAVAHCVTHRNELLAATIRRSKKEPPKAQEPAPESAPPSSSPFETIGPESNSGKASEDEQQDALRVTELEFARDEANAQLKDQQEAMARWQERLALAREKGDGELVEEAEGRIERHQRAMHAALAELARLDERWKALPDGPHRRGVEKQFRQMELDDALSALKRKMGRDS